MANAAAQSKLKGKYKKKKGTIWGSVDEHPSVRSNFMVVGSWNICHAKSAILIKHMCPLSE